MRQGWRCEHCGEAGSHVCRGEVIAFIQGLDEEDPEMEEFYNLYTYLQERGEGE
jgi:hypothetical protein